jgi:hypothetical protein
MIVTSHVKAWVKNEIRRALAVFAAALPEAPSGGSSPFAQKELATKVGSYATTGVLTTDEIMLVFEDVTVAADPFMLNLEYSTNGTDFESMPYAVISKPEGAFDANTKINMIVRLNGLIAGRGQLVCGIVTGNFFGTPLAAYAGYPTISLDGVVIGFYNPGAQIVKWRAVSLDSGLAVTGTIAGTIRVMTPGGA